MGLEAVLEHPAVWRGNECARAINALPTGFAELDAQLPGSGWPTGAITEIYSERAGVGELKLVMPAAARLTQAQRWITMIAAIPATISPIRPMASRLQKMFQSVRICNKA